MIFNWPACGRSRFWTMLPSLRLRKYLAGIVAGSAVAVYLFVYMYTPLVIMVWQNYDDSLFVKLGQYLAKGHWLGPYNQFTLMKGPGYPLFLAASYWSGLPITFTQGVFCCIALGVLSLVIFRATRSYLGALMVFVLPLLDPNMFEINRTLRDCIYSSQTVLIIAAFAYSLLLAGTRRRRLLSAIVAGALFGWFWLTREEGVWLLPPLIVLIVFAILGKRNRRSKAHWLSSSLVMIGVFIVVKVAFATLNFINYGSFVGVDFKERSFQSALSALESVRVSRPISYVNVPRAARMQIYAVSPHFAVLRPYLDPIPGPSPWEAGECMFHTEACGDIGNGFFMWALRDAVADVGAYKSPGRASEFYKAMAKEIDSACKAGRLRCEKRLIPYMPRMTSEQIRVIPRSALTLIHDVVVPGTDPTPRVQNVTGSQEQFAATLDFLNHPSHFPLYDDSPTTQIDLSGWFHNPSAGAGWFKFTVSDRHSKSLSYNLIRESSPDLVESQHDPAATRQRFVLRTQCGPGCVLHFSDETGSRDIPVTDSTAFYKKFINLGRGLLAFDSGKVVYPTPTAKDVRVIVAGKVRAGLYAIYDILLPILLSIGVLAFFVN